MPTENVTTKFKVDISDLKKNIQTANNQIKLLTAEMKNANAGMAKGAETADSLTTKIQKQGQIVQQEENKLQALKDQLARLNQNQEQGERIIADLTAKHQEAVRVYGEASDEAAAYAAELGRAQAAQERNRTAAERLNVQIVNQDTAVKNAKAAQNQYKTALDNMQAATEESTAATETLTQKISRQQGELNNLKQRYIDVTTAQGNNSSEAQELARQISELSGELNDNKTRLNEASGAADELDVSLQDVDDSANETTNGGLSAFGVALGNLAADIISNVISKMKEMVTQTVEVGQTFETSMSNVAALSGATGDELQMLTDTAKEYGSTTRFSASEAADALGYMALAGWDANQSADALGGVLNLAAASNMDLAAASDMVTDYMSAFGLEADKSAYFADLLAFAQANANTTAQGLGEAFKNSAANMNAAGQDIETTVSFLAMLANQGLKGSEAGTALTAVMRDMTAKMKDGKIAIGETSVEVMDAQGNYRDLTDILRDVESATQGMGDAEKASALQSTFTADSIKGLNLILNAGVDEAAAFESELRNSSGSAEEMAAIMGDNLSGDLTALGSKLEGIQIAIYEKFEPALRAGAEMLDKLLDAFSYLVDHSSEVVAALGAIAAGVGAYVAYTTAVTVFTKGWKALTVVTKAQAAAQAALNAVMALNPIGLIVAGIAALVAAFVILWKKSEKFRDFWKGLWEKIKNFAKVAWDAISGFFTAAWDKIQTLWGGLITFFSNVWNGIKTVFSTVATWINTNVFQPIINFFKPVIDFYTTAWKIIFELAKGAWESIKIIWGVVSTWFNDNIITPVSNFFSSLWGGISTAATNTWNAIKTVWAVVSTWFTDTIITPLSTAFSNLWTKVKTGASNAWTGIKNVFAHVADWFKEKFADAWQKVKDVFSTGGAIFEGIVDGIVAAFKNVVNAIIRGINNVIAIPFNAINDALDAIRNVEIAGIYPFDGLISRFDVPQIPELATGGIVNRPTPAIIGENGREAIIPLEKNKAGLRQIASLLADEINSAARVQGRTENNISYTFNQTNNSPKSLSRWEIYRQTKNLISTINNVNAGKV